MSTTPVSRDTVTSAVASLGKWMHGRSAASKPQLLLDDRDDFFVLLLSLHRIPSNCRTNPFFLSIPHPIFPLSDPTLTPSVFLIIDDRAADSPPPSKFLEEAKECNLPISEVIGISTLRTDYRAFESRRKLCGSHDLFLADKKILPLLPRLLGKSFFQKKKNPLPVNFSRVGWKDQIKRILNSTFFYLRSGTCCAIRVGRLAMEVEQVVDNVMAAIDEAVEKIPKKWGNVRSLNLKAVDSVALPIYQAVPEIGLKIEIGEREESGAEEVLDGDEVVEEKNEKKKKKKKKKGVPLAGEELVKGDGEDEGEEEKNKKRKKRSKEEGNGGEIEVVIKKKKKAGTGGDVEAKLETEAKKTKKKKNRQENIEIEAKNCAKTTTTKKAKKIVVEEKSEKKKKKMKKGASLAGEELVKGDGEDEGEEEKNKKRKKRSKEEGTGGEIEVVIKKKKKAGTGGDVEAKLKQKKGGAGGKFDNLETEAKKTKKKKNRQENIEIEAINCAKTKTKKEKKIGNVDIKLSNEIAEKMERGEKRKGKKNKSKV